MTSATSPVRLCVGLGQVLWGASPRAGCSPLQSSRAPPACSVCDPEGGVASQCAPSLLTACFGNLRVALWGGRIPLEPQSWALLAV